MTNNKLSLVVLAVAMLALAGCNRSGERAQDNFDAAGHSIGNAATDTGRGLSNGAQATGQAIGSGAQRTGNAIDNTVNGR
jgi:outer membrane biogenesis lipoprotein LolB